MYDIPVTLTTNPKKKPEDESKLGFGKIFTDHMFIMDYEQGRGWHDARVVPYGPFVMDPACTVFHYAQEIFEGMKCYRRKDGGLNLFRPRDNFARMNRSAERMGMPKIDVEEAMAGLTALLKADADWVPSAPGTSLYIRPTMISTDVMLGVHASHTYRFFIICSPSGAYYAKGLAPVGIYVEPELVRAVKGGVGFTKTGGNYAASILAGDIAEKKGYEQVLWLDGKENKYIEEVGSMNMFFKFKDALVTPPLLGSILGGITRDSIIKLAKHKGIPVDERRITVWYICKIYKTMGKKHCPSHMIKNEELEEAVLSSIKNEARKILTEDDISDLDKVQKIDSREQFYKKQIQIVDAELEKYQKFKKRAFTGYMEEMITPQEYRSYVAEYEEEISKLERQKEEILTKLADENSLQNQHDEWVEAFKDYINIEKLTRDVVIELIEKIEVHEDGGLDIYYRFRNPFQVAN